MHKKIGWLVSPFHSLPRRKKLMDGILFASVWNTFHGKFQMIVTFCAFKQVEENRPFALNHVRISNIHNKILCKNRNLYFSQNFWELLNCGTRMHRSTVVMQKVAAKTQRFPLELGTFAEKKKHKTEEYQLYTTLPTIGVSK